MSRRARPLVCAHRGASATLPDNSLAAFEAAIASGCDAIETDVRMSRDGRLILSHDPRGDHYPDAVELATLLDLAHGRIGLDLEVKEPGLGRALVDAVGGGDDWLLVTSFLPEALLEVRALAPSIATGLLLESLARGDPLAQADACGASAIVLQERLVTAETIAAARSGARPLWAWTVNDRSRLEGLLAEPAVTGVVTDDPSLAIRVRDAVGDRVARAE